MNNNTTPRPYLGATDLDDGFEIYGSAEGLLHLAEVIQSTVKYAKGSGTLNGVPFILKTEKDEDSIRKIYKVHVIDPKKDVILEYKNSPTSFYIKAALVSLFMLIIIGVLASIKFLMGLSM